MSSRHQGATPRKAADDEASLYTTAMAMASRRAAPKAPPRARRAKANTRLNKTGFVLYIDPKVNKQLRQLALDLDTSAHALGLVGLRLLLDALAAETPRELLADDPALVALVRQRAHATLLQKS